MLAGLLVAQLFVQPDYSPAEASGEPHGDTQGNTVPQAETTKPVSAGRPVNAKCVTQPFPRQRTSGAKTSGPARRQRGARGSPRRFPGWQAAGTEWHGADSPARPAPGGPPGRTELPGEALLSAGVPPGSGAGCRSVRVSHPCRELARAQCRANSLTPAGRGQRAQGVCLHIAKANVRHLKRQSPLKVLQVCTAGRRASNICGPNRQTHIAGRDSTPFSHGPQCG